MTTRFFAFGKLPSIGDFFRLGAPQGFVQVWDEWLQTSMLDAQARLGDRWDRLYMSMPIWRFSLAPGLAGGARVLGVLMPSVDRVGRRFPLTLMAPLQTPGQADLDHFGAEAVFVRLEDLALAALEHDMTREDLDAHLSQVKVPEPVAVSPPNGHIVPVVAQVGSAGPPDGGQVGHVGPTTTRPSVWSTHVGDVPRFMICDGLPQGADAQALFDLDASAWREV